MADVCSTDDFSGIHAQGQSSASTCAAVCDLRGRRKRLVHHFDAGGHGLAHCISGDQTVAATDRALYILAPAATLGGAVGSADNGLPYIFPVRSSFPDI